MSGRLDPAAKLLLAMNRIAGIRVALEFASGIAVTSFPRDWTAPNGTVHKGSGGDWSDAGEFTCKVEGIGESLRWETPSVIVRLQDSRRYFARRFVQDGYRRDLVTVRMLYAALWVPIFSGWEATWACDTDQANLTTGETTLRLACSDVTHGAQGPRRLTSEFGCQADYMGEGCGFRYRRGVHPASFAECPKTPEACEERFPPVTDPENAQKVPQPKPHGAFPGNPDSVFMRSGT